MSKTCRRRRLASPSGPLEPAHDPVAPPSSPRDRLRGREPGEGGGRELQARGRSGPPRALGGQRDREPQPTLRVGLDALAQPRLELADQLFGGGGRGGGGGARGRAGGAGRPAPPPPPRAPSRSRPPAPPGGRRAAPRGAA